MQMVNVCCCVLSAESVFRESGNLCQFVKHRDLKNISKDAVT